MTPTFQNNIIGPQGRVGLGVAAGLGLLIAGVVLRRRGGIAYLSEGLPESLQLLLDWIGNEEAKAIMTIGVVVNLVLIPYTAALFFGVRRILIGSNG